jgi:plasmid stabilization system protein ParE
VKGYRLSFEAQNDLEDIRQYLVKAGSVSVAGLVLRELRQALLS